MKFKTVSEFIHALEVEGKRFVHPTPEVNYFLYWDGEVNVVKCVSVHDIQNYFNFDLSRIDLTHDWQEYMPGPEPEEIELEEWLCEYGTSGVYGVDWIKLGQSHYDEDAFKTGVTRKVKVQSE